MKKIIVSIVGCLALSWPVICNAQSYNTATTTKQKKEIKPIRGDGAKVNEEVVRRKVEEARQKHREEKANKVREEFRKKKEAESKKSK